MGGDGWGAGDGAATGEELWSARRQTARQPLDLGDGQVN
jgi:hypothetical protein